MRYELQSDSPARSHKPGTQMVAARSVQVLTDQDTVALLLAAANRPLTTRLRDYVLVNTALLTGLRPAEVVSLTVWHIAPYGIVTDVLEVTSSIAKGAQPRKIPIHPDLKELFQRLLDWKEQNHQDVSPSAPLFISRKSTSHLTVRAFQMILKDIAIDALGRSINPHMLRHTFATRALQVSNLRTVQELLGHASVANTQIYTHPTSEDCRNAVNSLKL